MRAVNIVLIRSLQYRTQIKLLAQFEGFKPTQIDEAKEPSHYAMVLLLGAPPGTRTPDPLIKSQLLYQLS